MLAEHQSMSKGVALHTDNYIFPAAAIYLAMKEVCPEIAYEIMKKTMAEKSTRTGKKIAKCCKLPGFKKFFLSMWDPISHKMFGESSGFKNVFYPKEKRLFRMDVTQCPYHTYLSETGCPELNILFCKNDEYAYGNLPGIRFTRTGTIATGNKRCDFKMELM